MRQSQLFTKTRREDPSDEMAKNARLLIRAGFIYKNMAGVYSFLPLGLLVMEKIKSIIREEMNGIGGQEVALSSLQEKDIWEKTDRWDDEKVDIWFKTYLKNGTELGLAMSHEEALTMIMKDHVRSYRDLPIKAYQFQNKFRNELRSKSGLMRGREFLMKDLYSFHSEADDLDDFYGQVETAYENIFKRCGLGDLTYKTFASGGIFTKFSHEYQTISEAGEDIIYVSKDKKIAINEEVYNDEVLASLGVSRAELTKEKSIEVGNIFKLGTRYSEPLGLSYLDETGKSFPVVMGSYGIGVGRLMGTIAEVLSDQGGIVWPKEVSPFSLHLVSLGNNEEVLKQSDDLYKSLAEKGIDVLYDDRNLSAGEKLSDADLIGIPLRLVVSEKNLNANKWELKYRRTGEVEFVEKDSLFGKF